MHKLVCITEMINTVTAHLGKVNLIDYIQKVYFYCTQCNASASGNSHKLEPDSEGKWATEENEWMNGGCILIDLYKKWPLGHDNRHQAKFSLFFHSYFQLPAYIDSVIHTNPVIMNLYEPNFPYNKFWGEKKFSFITNPLPDKVNLAFSEFRSLPKDSL